MTLRDVPAWVYVALAILWASTVVTDAATVALDPDYASLEISWAQFVSKHSAMAMFWMGTSVGALAWFGRRSISASNVWSTLGLTALVGVAVCGGYGVVLTAALYVITRGTISFHEAMGLAWSWNLLAAYLTVWKIAVLTNTYLYYHRASLRRRESTALRVRLAEAELALFRAQLEPHFLFNTLNSIAALVRLGRNADATDALSQLGTLLRGLLRIGNHPVVSWAWERQFTERYVALQKLRFAQRLTVVIECPDVPPQTGFPAFLLQPLIENAIRHGPLDDAQSCDVRVRVERVGARVRVEVRNPMGHGPGHAGAGIGINNIESRLWALFGEDASFQGDVDGEQFVAAVEFPASSEHIPLMEDDPCR